MKLSKVQAIAEELENLIMPRIREYTNTTRNIVTKKHDELSGQMRDILRFLPALQRDSVDIEERLRSVEKQLRHLSAVVKLRTGDDDDNSTTLPGTNG